MSGNRTNFKKSSALRRVDRGDLCTGCGLCAGVAPAAIRMVVAQPGYLRPVQTAPLDDMTEEQISRCCPGLTQTVHTENRIDDPLWGPFFTMETGHAEDPAVRFAGSSGGVLSQIAAHLIETGQVDAVVQTKASTTLPIGNMATISDSRPEVIDAAGSRYAPSSPLDNIASLIKDGRRFAFIGKPCDAAALRAYCNENQAAKAAFPVILSFFCAGVPSHSGGKAVLEVLGTSLDDTSAFRFRGNGWPGQASATLSDGTTRSMSYHDSWGKILSKYVQHRCKICADGTGVAADIVCADAWEADDKGYPLFEEADGVSLIVTRTALGQKILDGAKATGAITTAPFAIKTLAAIQPGQRERRRALLARLLALRLVGRPVPTYNGLQILAASRQNTFKKNVKNFLGTLRRALKSKR